MKNIHLIPTDKPSSLYILGNNELKLRYTIDLPIDSDIAVNQHIYITNHEEIKAKDWIISKSTGELIKSSKSYCANNEYGKKIILTTDQDFIQDGVQAIDDEFLEWFVKNPSCEEVKVVIMNKGYDSASDFPYQEFYKIIIPKEEPTEEAKQRAENYMSLKGALEPKQETLEEAAEKEYPIKIESIMEGYHDVNSYQRNAFIKGAKLAQETMYSEEEVLVILDKFLTAMIKGEKTGLLEKWFEQFKKK